MMIIGRSNADGLIKAQIKMIPDFKHTNPSPLENGEKGPGIQLGTHCEQARVRFYSWPLMFEHKRAQVLTEPY